MNNAFKIFCLFLILFLSINLVSAEDDGTFTELQNVINDAESSKSLVLDKNYTYVKSLDRNLSNGIFIATPNFVLDGNGFTIDGVDDARIFQIITSNVTIKNLNFNNGIANGGGGIRVMGSVTIIDSNFTNNHATGAGGAIDGSSLTIINTRFINNGADSGGAIRVSGVLNITGSFFENNSARLGSSIYSNFGGSANYNVILDSNPIFANVYGSRLNINYNWWGTNDLPTIDGYIIFDNYYLMNISNGYINGSKYIFDYNFDLNSTEYNNPLLLPLFNANFYINNDIIGIFDARKDSSVNTTFSSSKNIISLVSNNNEIANLTFESSISGEDLIKHFRNASQYTVKVLGNVEGLNVVFNINGINYNRTIVNGTATLNINLYSGDYVITAKGPDGVIITNKITVLPILIGSDLNKKFSEKGTYDVKVFGPIGQLLSNVTIKININGVIYDRISDNDGIVRLNINLNPGSYIATAIFEGYSTSNTVTVIDS